jgi:predicted SnoaL-like aldol condensation-catalyzing enzyme
MAKTVQEMRNLAIASEMYARVLTPLDSTDVDRYFPPDYVQHGSLAEDGREALKRFLDNGRRQYPRFSSTIKRAFVDGDHVIFHVHVVLEPGAPGMAVVDIFRMADGLIQEHWEVIQPVPETLPHGNGTF